MMEFRTALFENHVTLVTLENLAGFDDFHAYWTLKLFENFFG